MDTTLLKDIIRKKLDLSYIIGKYIAIKKRGKYYIGLCPFHKEKTPSFFIYYQHYKCYGCGNSGDIISFLSKLMNKSFFSTIFYLTKKYKIVNNKDFHFIPLYIRQQNRVKYILNLSHKYFQNNLFKYEISLKYLIKYRCLSLNSIKTYQIGYGGNMTKYCIFLQKNNILLKELCKIGLIKYIKQWVFIFSGRIIFPIRNIKGEVISFIGRTIFINNHKKKYINCLNSKLYNRNKVFFGFFEATRQSKIYKYKNIVVVEGVFDVLAIYEVNCLAIASGGANLSYFHIQCVKLFFSKISICFDNDIIGLKKTIFLLKLFLHYQIYPYFLSISFKDPGDALKKKMKGILNNQLYIVTNFLDDMIYKSFFNIVKDKCLIKYINNLFRVVNIINDKNLRRMYFEKYKVILIKTKLQIVCMNNGESIFYNNINHHLNILMFIILQKYIKLFMDSNFIKIMLDISSISFKFFLMQYIKILVNLNAISKKRYKKLDLLDIVLLNKTILRYSNCLIKYIPINKVIQNFKKVINYNIKKRTILVFIKYLFKR